MMILIDEWGSSGKLRPTVGHLLQLLIKLELFLAADYVAEVLLKEPPPERPAQGPAARIDITLTPDFELNLTNMVYPESSSLVPQTTNTFAPNLDAPNGVDYVKQFNVNNNETLALTNGHSSGTTETAGPSQPMTNGGASTSTLDMSNSSRQMPDVSLLNQLRSESPPSHHTTNGDETTSSSRSVNQSTQDLSELSLSNMPDLGALKLHDEDSTTHHTAEDYSSVDRRTSADSEMSSSSHETSDSAAITPNLSALQK